MNGPAKYLTVKQTAQLLNVSESWVSRHKSRLPLVRIGGMVRFDAELLSRQIESKMSVGNPLKPNGGNVLRFQRGYVRLRGRKAVWYGMYRDEPTAEGVRPVRQIRLGTKSELPTKTDARNKLAEILGHKPKTTRMSFTELVERWRKAEGPTRREDAMHESHINHHFLPAFGRRDITEIRREDIQLYLNEKAAKYAANTLLQHKSALGLIFGWAEANDWISKNPVRGVKLPKQTGGRTVNRAVLTPDQVKALADRLQEPYATFILFLYATGLRISEAIAVRWVDFEGNILHVTHQIYEGVEGPLKTRCSVRNLLVEDWLLERMRGLGEGEFIFRSRKGTPLHRTNVMGRYVRPAAKALGLSLGGFHDARHTLSTTLRRNGAHPKVVAAILGHSKVNLAMDVYDRADLNDMSQPLHEIAHSLQPNAAKTSEVA